MSTEVEERKMRDHKPVFAVVTSIHADFDARIWKHATSLARHGHEVHLICPWNVREGALMEGVILHPFPRVMQRWKRPCMVPLRVFGKLKPLMRRISIIHFHDIDLLPWMALMHSKKHIVYDVHENYPEEMLIKEWVPQWLRKPLSHAVQITQLFLSRRIRNVVLVVDAQDKDFNHPDIKKVHIWNYASVKLLENVAEDYSQRPACIVFTGTQYVANGSLLLLDVAERLHKIAPDVKLLITDDMFSREVSREYMLNEIRARGIEGMVELTPRVKSQEMMRVLNRATIAIVPILRVPKALRAVPTKLFEYMAAGLPVVASDLPYPAKVIEACGCGVLAQPEDPDSYVRAIQKLLSDRSLAYELGKNGQYAFRNRYSWEGQFPQLLAFYESICPDLDFKPQAS